MKRKIIALALCAAMLASAAVPGTLATTADSDSSSDQDVVTTELDETTTPATCEYCDAALIEDTAHEADCPTNCTCTPVDGVHQGECVFASVSESTDAKIGTQMWIKSGSKVYQSITDTQGYTVQWSYKIEITSIVTVGGEIWYEYEYVDWSSIVGGIFLGNYHYIKASDTSVEEPGKPADSEKETTVDDMKLKVQGVSENVTLSAKKVTPNSWHEEVFDAIGSKKVVFALDITLTDEDGLWQPADSQSVTVTLDVASLGLAEGERIGILHDHDSTLSDIGIYTVTDGKLTFTTDNFSVFYGYTVDFEYDGTWHSISGDSYIYLSELFEALNIDKDVNTVSSVSFSNEELIAITHLTYIEEEGGGQDWRLSSLTPFDTEELLKVAFSDGESLEINVYDKAWGTDNIDGDETWSDQDTHGNRKVTKDSTISINPDATVKLNGTITIPNGKTLTIQCTGDATLMRNNSTGILFYVNGGKLIINSDTGTITVDGDSKTVNRSAFVVGASSSSDNDSDGSVLELKNVNIQNCYSNNVEYGGAIHLIRGNENDPSLFKLTMENCVIDNCRAPHGSAIFFRNYSTGEAIITDTVVQNCVAYGKTTTDGDDQGGTIRTNGASGAVVVLERCIIRNNRSGYSDLDTAKPGSRCYGGGIYWNAAAALSVEYPDLVDSDNTRAKMYIYDCQITDNKATNRGGGIFNESAMYIGTKYTDDFTANKVSNTSEIRGTLVDSNYANGYTGDKSYNYGGGIMVPTYNGGNKSGQKMDVSIAMGKGVFITNNESQYGGGFAVRINKTKDKNDGVTFYVDCDGAVIEKNTAVEDGGGIYLTMSYEKYIAKLNLTSGSISNNNAKNGGGIYVNNTNVNIGTEETIVDNPIEIAKNTADENGGGIYLNQEMSYTETAVINVSNGLITENTAIKYGGGIFQTGAIGNCIVTGDGIITENTAANGGGIYIADGKLDVSGGIITFNKAIGSYSGETAKDATSGVGGGIYVSKGSFTMSGDSVGLHSNTASVAANDAYASGDGTTLTLPDVEKMTLEDWKGTGNPEGWFADYMETDVNYPTTVIIDAENNSTTNPGRYNYYDEDKVEVLYDKVLSTNATTYYCLTIGTPHPGYGNLEIEKTLNAPAEETQTFIFEVTGKTRKSEKDYSLTVTLVIKEGEKNAQVLVANIPDGTYTITEKEAWSWRYDQTSRTFQPKDGDVIEETTFTVDIENPEWIAKFINSRTENYWLSGDSYCENWWGGSDGNVILKEDE